MRLHNNFEGRRFGWNWSSLTDSQVRDLTENARTEKAAIRHLIYQKSEVAAGCTAANYSSTTVRSFEPEAVKGISAKVSSA